MQRRKFFLSQIPNEIFLFENSSLGGNAFIESYHVASFYFLFFHNNQKNRLGMAKTKNYNKE